MADRSARREYSCFGASPAIAGAMGRAAGDISWITSARSEEHTSELQSQSNIVCRLLLEKKKVNNDIHPRLFARRYAKNANSVSAKPSSKRSDQLTDLGLKITSVNSSVYRTT